MEIAVRRIRTPIVSDTHTMSDSPVTDTAHKSNARLVYFVVNTFPTPAELLYTPPITSPSVFTLNATTHDTVPNLEDSTSHTVNTSSHQFVLLSPQLSGEETDTFSEEVKSKPHSLSHDHNTSIERSYSSEASTPAKSPLQFSSSPFSPNRDHSSYSESFHPTSPPSDKPQQATTTTGQDTYLYSVYTLSTAHVCNEPHY